MMISLLAAAAANVMHEPEEVQVIEVSELVYSRCVVGYVGLKNLFPA